MSTDFRVVVVLLSGPICAGKSTVGSALVTDHGFRAIRSSEYLRKVAAEHGLAADRRSLQTIGDERDGATGYRWLIDEVARPAIERMPQQGRWLLDSVRKGRQVELFKAAFPRVLHVHIIAPESDLQRRFEERARVGKVTEAISYAEAIAHPNEISARSLSNIADLVLKNDPGNVTAILHRVCALETDVV